MKAFAAVTIVLSLSQAAGPSFDVASIKRSVPVERGPRGFLPTPGRLTAADIPAAALIGFAFRDAMDEVRGAPEWSTKENYDVVTNPRVEVVYDDARHYILTTKETFDIITSDPIHPWVKGAATLYTKEYFDLVKRHLNPAGLFTQWVPLYESNPGVVKSEVATFFDVFPKGTIWSNDQDGEGYDIVLLGKADGLKIDVDELQERMHRDPRVAQSLQEVGFRTVVSLLGTYAGQGPDLGPWLKQAEINRDRNLRLQYLAGLGSNPYESAYIYEEILAYRRVPSDRFTASEATKRDSVCVSPMRSMKWLIRGSGPMRSV